MAVYGSRVFLFLSKNKWKETWLSFSEDGVLTWKRKDAYQVKGSVEIEGVFEKIQVRLPDEKHLHNGMKPFFLSIPLKVKGKMVTKKLALKNGPDMELWLSTLANADGQLRLFLAVKGKHVNRLAETKELSEQIVLEKIDYKELITFYKNLWDEFLRHRRNPPPPEQTETLVAVSSGVHLIQINGHASEASFRSQTSLDDLDEDESDNDEVHF